MSGSGWYSHRPNPCSHTRGLFGVRSGVGRGSCVDSFSCYMAESLLEYPTLRVRVMLFSGASLASALFRSYSCSRYIRVADRVPTVPWTCRSGILPRSSQRSSWSRAALPWRSPARWGTGCWTCSWTPEKWSPKTVSQYQKKTKKQTKETKNQTKIKQNLWRRKQRLITPVSSFLTESSFHFFHTVFI